MAGQLNATQRHPPHNLTNSGCLCHLPSRQINILGKCLTLKLQTLFLLGDQSLQAVAVHLGLA
ncbi:hypothetical protein D3C75_1245890 [compost metagenome]